MTFRSEVAVCKFHSIFHLAFNEVFSEGGAQVILSYTVDGEM